MKDCILCGNCDSERFGCHHYYCKECISIHTCVSCKDIKYRLNKYFRARSDKTRNDLKNYIIKKEGIDFWESLNFN